MMWISLATQQTPLEGAGDWHAVQPWRHDGSTPEDWQDYGGAALAVILLPDVPALEPMTESSEWRGNDGYAEMLPHAFLR